MPGLDLERGPNSLPKMKTSFLLSLLVLALLSLSAVASAEEIVDFSTAEDAASAELPEGRPPVPPTEEYRIGVGDVLDIRLADMPTQESTLFTVLTGGVIDYPLLGEPLKVGGLTTDEILARLTNGIKVIKNPRVSVKVRDYFSHRVIVSGAVENPGAKPLRREAMPLYTVLAAALPRADATVATIVRAGKAQPPLPLVDQKAMSTLVFPGDVIRVNGKSDTRQFFYVGGQVASPGEKDFRTGMTLTQGLLACGGVTRGTAVKVSRRNSDGFLATSEYDLRAIETGRSPDPLLQAGDRIEVR